jgi:DivIVA domain-containing protein
MKRPGSLLFERIAHAEAQGAEEDVSSGMFDMEEEHPAMTPDAIRFQHFGVRLLRGLNPEEVRAFLYLVAEEWETVQRTNRALETEIRRLKDEVQTLTIKASTSLPDVLRGAEPQTTAVVPEAEQNEAAATTRLEVLRSAALQEVEALLHDAGARARALTDAAQDRAATIVHEAEALKSQQQQEAEEIVAGATATAESIMMAARREEAALRQDLDRLAESRLRLFDDVRATLDACHEWLATVDPRSGRPGPGERNVSSESVTNGQRRPVDGGRNPVD